MTATIERASEREPDKRPGSDTTSAQAEARLDRMTRELADAERAERRRRDTHENDLRKWRLYRVWAALRDSIAVN